MALQKIDFAPGINKEGTQYTADSGWYDADKVRFRKGKPEKIGGWEKYTSSSYKGIARSILDWVTGVGTKYFGIGTNLKFYVAAGSEYSDITPLRATTSAGDATFAATNGSSTITVTETSHGAVNNDFVTFSDAATLGGNITAAVLNQEYQIVNVLTANTFTITAKDTSGDTVTANASDSGNGGGSTVAAFQINTGLNSWVDSTGWGVGLWNAGAWSSSTSISATNQLRLYSQDSFADDLIFNVRGGGVYYWDESGGTGARGVALSAVSGASDAPAKALQVMVSDVDRHVIAFGASPIGSTTIDPLFVRWSDQESAVNWTPTATNTAGGQLLSSGSLIIGAVKTRQEILIWTDFGLQSMRFVGSPFIFQFASVAEGVSMISPKAAVAVGDAVFFMDNRGFYVYRGSVERLPCTVLDYVLSNLNTSQTGKVFAASNPDYSEVMWFYPVGSGNTDITNYVAFNYLENVWTIGTMARGTWNYAPSRNNPVASSCDTDNVNTNYLYNQELGYNADGEELAAYIESGDLELSDGEQFIMIRKIIPDFNFGGTAENVNMTLTLKGKDYPLNTASTLTTATVGATTAQSHVRARSRDIIFRVESSGTDYNWRLGTPRFDMRTDGRR